MVCFPFFNSYAQSSPSITTTERYKKQRLAIENYYIFRGRDWLVRNSDKIKNSFNESKLLVHYHPGCRKLNLMTLWNNKKLLFNRIRFHICFTMCLWITVSWKKFVNDKKELKKKQLMLASMMNMQKCSAKFSKGCGGSFTSVVDFW